MTDLLQYARGKLDDPLVVEWAIRRYDQATGHNPALAQKMAEAWFDDLTLQRLIGTDEHDLLTSLFNRLPKERWDNVHTSVAKKWSNWRSSLGYQSAPILLKNDPEKAVDLFVEHLTTNFGDANKTLAIIQLLPDFPDEVDKQLLERITVSVIAHSGNHFTKGFYLNGLLPVTIEMNPETAESVLSEVLKIEGEKDGVDRVLHTLSHALYNSSGLLDLGVMIRKNKSLLTFSSLHPFFLDDAPLAECDKILKGSKLLTSGLHLLAQRKDHSHVTQIAYKLIQHAQSLVARGKHPDLGCLAVASVLHSYERELLNSTNLSLEEAVDLLSLDLPSHPHAHTLTDYLLSQDTGEVAAAINKKMPAVKNDYGGIHLARASGVLGLTDLAPMLIDCMEKNSGDYICEAAQTALSRLGDVGSQAVIDNWSRLDFSQQIYGASVIKVVGGLQASEFAIQQFETMFYEEQERWCELALAAPDQRLIKLLEPELRREQRLIDRAFYLMCILTDHPYKNLETIHARIMDDRKRQQERREAFDSGKPIHETLSLQLRCPLCGDENDYDVKRVLLSEKPTEIPHLLVDEFPCASCGKWPEFEFTSYASMALTAELLSLQAEKSSGREQRNSPVQLLSVTYRWEERSAPDVVAELKSAIAEDPDSERNWVVMGRVSFLLGRPREARECWKRIYDKDPTVMEAGLGIAQVMSDSGAPEPAFKLLTDLLEHKEKWRFLRVDELSPKQLGGEFSELYNNLHRRLNITDRPFLHQSFMGQQRKIGRNDPCPCGSGKKYKKCCLNG